MLESQTNRGHFFQFCLLHQNLLLSSLELFLVLERLLGKELQLFVLVCYLFLELFGQDEVDVFLLTRVGLSACLLALQSQLVQLVYFFVSNYIREVVALGSVRHFLLAANWVFPLFPAVLFYFDLIRAVVLIRDVLLFQDALY